MLRNGYCPLNRTPQHKFLENLGGPQDRPGPMEPFGLSRIRSALGERLEQCRDLLLADLERGEPGFRLVRVISQ